MPGAVIIADQPAGAGAGVAGQGRNDLWRTRPIVLTGVLGGNATFAWSLLAAPPGSAATLSTPGTNISGFTPDVLGTYRVQFVTNGGGPGNVQILVFRVRYDAAGTLTGRGWALPAFGEVAGESNYGSNAAGWAEPLQYIFADILANAFGGGFVTNPLGAPLAAALFKITGLGAPTAASNDAATAIYAETVANAAAAVAQAASQPLDSDLTAIAALTTTAFGRSFLDRVDAPAARTLLGLGTAATFASAAFDAAGAAASAQAASAPTGRNLTAGAGLTGGGDLTADRTFDVVANADGSIVVNPDDLQVGVLATDGQHGSRGGGALHALVVAAGAAGFMSGADKTKLDAYPNQGITTVTITVADYTLNATEAGRRVLVTQGVLTGDRALIVDTALHPLTAGDRYVVVNKNTGPQTLLFKASSSGTGVWVPPTSAGVSVVWTGTDFVYVDGGGGVVLQANQTVSQVGAAGPTDTLLWKIPLGWGIAGAAVRSTQTGAGGGVVTTSLGTSPGGADLIAAHSPGAAGTGLFHTGSGFAAGAELIASGTVISARQQNTLATTTDFIESYTVRVVLL